MRIDFVGQYIDIGSRVIGIVEERKVPDGFRKVYLQDLALIELVS